jgi:hypothetical protein
MCILTCIPSDKCPGVVSLDHVTVLFVVTRGASILLSTVVVLIYISINSVLGFFFPASSPPFVVVCILDDSNSDCSEVKSQCHFHFVYVQGC